mgnify:CR=1 FL=1
MSREDIEATKAPLLDHLIELRGRLIKSLVAFVVLFVLCFTVSRQIYNILIYPFEWAARSVGDPNVKLIYTAPLEFFFTHMKVAMFGAAFIGFPVIASQLYMFVAPGLYRHERQAFLPYLIATPVFFLLLQGLSEWWKPMAAEPTIHKFADDEDEEPQVRRKPLQTAGKH